MNDLIRLNARISRKKTLAHINSNIGFRLCASKEPKWRANEKAKDNEQKKKHKTKKKLYSNCRREVEKTNERQQREQIIIIVMHKRPISFLWRKKKWMCCVRSIQNPFSPIPITFHFYTFNFSFDRHNSVLNWIKKLLSRIQWWRNWRMNGKKHNPEN